MTYPLTVGVIMLWTLRRKSNMKWIALFLFLSSITFSAFAIDCSKAKIGEQLKTWAKPKLEKSKFILNLRQNINTEAKEATHKTRRIRFLVSKLRQNQNKMEYNELSQYAQQKFGETKEEIDAYLEKYLLEKGYIVFNTSYGEHSTKYISYHPYLYWILLDFF